MAAPSLARGVTASRHAAVLAALLALGGCAQLAPRDDPAPFAPWAAETTPVEEPANAALEPIGTAALGALVALPAGNALGVARAHVLDEYHAASGRTCRRVALPNLATTRVVCRGAGGPWRAVRSLGGGRRPALFVPAADAEAGRARADG